MSPLPDIDDLWDDEEEQKTFAKVMFPFLLLGFIKGIENTAVTKKIQDLLTGSKRQDYYTKSLQYAAISARTTKNALTRQIDLAISEGESVKQLAIRIDSLYGSRMGYNSLRIARTQLTETVNDGVYSTLRAEGNGTKTWSTVIDGAERDSHHRANGQTVPIDSPFQLDEGSGMYPGDSMLPISETAQCRCTMVAGGTPDGSARRIGILFLRTHGSLERKYVISLRRAFTSQKDRILSRLPSSV